MKRKLQSVGVRVAGEHGFVQVQCRPDQVIDVLVMHRTGYRLLWMLVYEEHTAAFGHVPSVGVPMRELYFQRLDLPPNFKLAGKPTTVKKRKA